MAGGSVKRFRFKMKPEDPAGLLAILGCQTRALSRAEQAD